MMAGWGEVLSWALVRERKEGQVRGTWTPYVRVDAGEWEGIGEYLKKRVVAVGGLNDPHRGRTTPTVLKRLLLADILLPSSNPRTKKQATVNV